MRYSIIQEAEKSAYTAGGYHHHGPCGEWHRCRFMPFDRWESDDNCFHYATGMIYEYHGYSYVEYITPDGTLYLD